MNDDLISREALRNVILNDRKLDGANANWEVNRILVHIDNAPTIEPDVEFARVDTDELLKKLNDSIGATMGEQIPRWLWEGVVDELEKRPKGKWIEQKNYPYQRCNRQLGYECNQCGTENTYRTNFCPNCGADMREGGAENETDN